MSANLINIIFGMKVRQARTEADFTVTEFARQCELSPSYVTEIEKGRKYPRADKIMKIAEVLGKSYDDLVSIKMASSLSYLETTISSSAFQRFPYEEFGLELGDLVTLLTREPDKASALLHAIMDMTSRYGLSEEDFLRATLRSYQEIHENYFQELEDAALEMTTQWGDNAQPPIGISSLERILTEQYGYSIDRQTIAQKPVLSKYRSVLLPGKRPCLLINPALRPRQVKFLLAREIGYQYLGLTERSLASTPDEIHTFQQILNDFKAAYFGGGLLMPRALILSDLEHFFGHAAWQPDLLVGMLDRYGVTPEMLFYRFSELIPQFFGIKLHFLRYHQREGGSYELIKQLNMDQLIVPSGIGVDQHYCRRWLSVQLLREMPHDSDQAALFDRPYVGVQLSEFLESHDRFLCMGFARPLVLSPTVNSSVIVGFRVDSDLNNAIRFATDPAIPRVIINETCERCPLTDEQCHLRGAPPTHLLTMQQQQARKVTLAELQNQLRN